MPERIALDYSHGVKPEDDIPDSTWTDIEPDRVIDLALKHIPDHTELGQNPTLRKLASLIEPTISPELRARMLEVNGGEPLLVDTLD